MNEENVEIEYIVDEDGKWAIQNGLKSLIEPSKEWIARNRPSNNVEPDVTQDDYNMDFDLRICILELGV